VWLVFATASRSRRSNLTNVVVRQAMRTGTGHSSVITVQVFDIFSVIQASERFSPPEPLCKLAGARAHRTSQNVCSYYDLRMFVRHRW
jgi:hypothetical protein